MPTKMAAMAKSGTPLCAQGPCTSSVFGR
jgi:hypothetical protein